jgi:2,3-bisphosphoglycerate-independent phosphoglycerate mutase
MSAPEVTREVVTRIRSENYGFIVLNFANLDMVGHTGKLPAAIEACEVVDTCLEEVLSAVSEKNGMALVTADHGNAEEMINRINGGPHTAHTSANPVPVVLVDGGRPGIRLRDGILADVAPTILNLMGIPIPEGMSGRSLIIGKK